MTEENDEEKTNRKSLRLKNSLTKPAPTTTTTATSKRRQVNETVNGAQFVSAASVGKINVNNNNNNNNLSESNGDAKQIDLVKLSQNVDEMSKILTEHAGLFKKLTNSIDKLSNKLDNTVKNINTTDHEAKKASKAATEPNSDTGNAKSQTRGRLKKRRNDDEPPETSERVDAESCAKKVKHQEHEEKNEIADDEEDDIELINQNKLITSSEQDKQEASVKITFTANSSVNASSESGKLIKLKLEDDLPPNESQDGHMKPSVNSSSKETLNVDGGNKKITDSADSNVDQNQPKTNNSSLNNSNYMTGNFRKKDFT